VRTLIRLRKETGGGDQSCHTTRRSNVLQNQPTNAMQESDEGNNELS
jgi:hypothetical protein